MRPLVTMNDRFIREFMKEEGLEDSEHFINVLDKLDEVYGDMVYLEPKLVVSDDMIEPDYSDKYAGKKVVRRKKPVVMRASVANYNNETKKNSYVLL